MIAIGLTGSIGMGKSTVTGMFAGEGAETWNADDAVHRLYQPGAKGAQAVAAKFPAVVGEGGVDRDALSKLVLDDPAALADLEAIIHPLVSEDRSQFLDAAARSGADIVVLDIPLLFEKGYEKFFDAVVVVTAPAEVQRARVLARPGMSEKKFRSVLMKQTPDAEKRRRADYVIRTDVSLEETRAQVARTVADIRARFGL
ncbi:MAG: dephospho-CoA kinase [Parvularculaceae bacterium]